jgi:hypothetical protein
VILSVVGIEEKMKNGECLLEWRRTSEKPTQPNKNYYSGIIMIYHDTEYHDILVL